MDTDTKKRLKDDYKHKLNVGAVYALECSGNHRRWIRSTTDIQGIKNRFQFAISMKGCPDPVTRAECDRLWMGIHFSDRTGRAQNEGRSVDGGILR